MIDQDQDGFIDADDLKEIFTSLGADPNDDFVNQMIAEAPGKIIKGPQINSGRQMALAIILWRIIERITFKNVRK